MEQTLRRYDPMDLSRGFNNSACLMVNTASLESVLNSPLPSSAPRRERTKIPFVVAVSRSAYLPPMGAPGDDIAGSDFKGYFNVAVESLLEEFYSIVALDITDLWKMTVKFRHEDDIWCDSTRWGIHRAQSSDAAEDRYTDARNPVPRP